MNPESSRLETLAALERQYRAEGRWQEVIQVLERKGEVVQTLPEKIDVLIQIAEIWAHPIGDRAKAAGVYRELRRLDESLAALCSETEDWGSSIELLLRQLDLFDEPSFKVTIAQKLARVYEQNLGDLDGAFESLTYAFHIDHGNEDTKSELERLATAHGKWGELLGEYNVIVRTIEDRHEQSALWVKIGRWYSEHLNRVDYGLKCLEEALKLDPDNVQALHQMASFYRRSNNNVELARTLARVVRLAVDADTQVRTLLSLAEVQKTGLADVPAAIESYRRVLAIDAHNVAARDALAQLRRPG